MPTASNLTPESRFMALFVGPKHSGKTVAACSWLSKDPKKRAKVLDGDGRIRGILGAPWIDKTRIDYDYFPPKIAGNTSTFFQRVNDDLDALMTLIGTGKSPYETYISDSATAFCKNLILDAIPLTHAENKGKRLGTVNMAGPEDYGFESTGMDSYLSFLRSLPINVIMTAHVIDKFDKPMVTVNNKTYKDAYADSIKVGEKLSLRDKISANMSIYFDHIFRFDREVENGQEKFYVEYISDLACTSFPGFKPGYYDITGKDFREFTLALANKVSSNVNDIATSK
jgi:hypothetical protein